MKPHHIVLAIVVGTPLVAAGAPKDKEARAHMAKAAKAHKEGKFEQALIELQAAYDLTPTPDLQYAIGQVDVKLGKCGEARAAYDKFLVAHKDAAATVRQALAACKEAAPPPAPEPPPPPPPAAEPAAPPPPPPAPPPVVTPAPVAPSPAARPDSPFAAQPRTTVTTRPWYTDKLGDGLVLGGTAVGVVGLIMYAGAAGKLDDAEHAKKLDQYKHLVDDAHAQRTYAAILIGGVVALIGAGVVHYLIGDRSTESRAVGVAPARGGGVVTYGGSF